VSMSIISLGRDCKAPGILQHRATWLRIFYMNRRHREEICQAGETSAVSEVTATFWDVRLMWHPRHNDRDPFKEIWKTSPNCELRDKTLYFSFVSFMQQNVCCVTSKVKLSLCLTN
jgi:hypothetical protein